MAQNFPLLFALASFDERQDWQHSFLPLIFLNLFLLCARRRVECRRRRFVLVECVRACANARVFDKLAHMNAARRRRIVSLRATIAACRLLWRDRNERLSTRIGENERRTRRSLFSRRRHRLKSAEPRQNRRSRQLRIASIVNLRVSIALFHVLRRQAATTTTMAPHRFCVSMLALLTDGGGGGSDRSQKKNF